MAKRTTKTALNAACHMLDSYTGSCPQDLLGVEPWAQPCDDVCELGIEWRCWREYFMLAGNKGGQWHEVEVE